MHHRRSSASVLLERRSGSRAGWERAVGGAAGTGGRSGRGGWRSDGQTGNRVRFPFVGARADQCASCGVPAKGSLSLAFASSCTTNMHGFTYLKKVAHKKRFDSRACARELRRMSQQSHAMARHVPMRQSACMHDAGTLGRRGHNGRHRSPPYFCVLVLNALAAVGHAGRLSKLRSGLSRITPNSKSALPGGDKVGVFPDEARARRMAMASIWAHTCVRMCPRRASMDFVAQHRDNGDHDATGSTISGTKPEHPKH